MTIEDFDDVYPLICQWTEDMGITVPYDGTKDYISRLLAQGPTILLWDNQKVIGIFSCRMGHQLSAGQFAPDSMNPMIKQSALFDELIYIDKGYRGRNLFSRLLEAVEKIAKSVGCGEVHISPLVLGSRSPETVRDMLLGKGYMLYGYKLMKGV